MKTHFEYLHTGMRREEVDAWVNKWNEDAGELRLFFDSWNELSKVQRRKGFWILAHLCAQSRVAQPYVSKVYDLFLHAEDSSIRRESFTILFNLQISEEMESKMLEHAFATLGSKEAEVAERHHGLKWLIRSCESYPELYEEVISTLDFSKEFATPAWKNYSTKLIAKLESKKLKALKYRRQ